MEFFAPTLQLTITNNFQNSGSVVEDVWNQESEASTVESGWQQTNEPEDFNNYTEEY